MIYLSGGINQQVVRASSRGDLGLLLQPAKGNRAVAGVPFAIDNDCFSTLRHFDEDRWLEHLERLWPSRADCLFATTPDIVGDAEATHGRSYFYLDTIAYWGYPVAFVTQDGATDATVPWDLIDCLFVGGSTVWKLGEPSVTLIREAKRRGKWVHMGRVNSRQRLLAAAAVGVDSADGTHIAFAPDRHLPQVLGWLDAVNGTCWICDARLAALRTASQRPEEVYPVGPLTRRLDGHQLYFLYQGRRHVPIPLCQLTERGTA